MKHTTLTKTITFASIERYLLALDNTSTIESMGEGYEVDFWIKKIGKELKIEEFVKLSENFTCIGFDEVETFTFIRISYLTDSIKTYAQNNPSEDFLENAITFGAADSIIKRTNFEVGEQPKNIASQIEMTLFEEGNNTELVGLVNDIEDCGTMELYYDNFADFLDTIIGSKNRLITGENLDIFLDTIVDIFPKEVYYAKREEKQAIVLVSEIELFLNNLRQYLTIDPFNNQEKIVEFIAEDILECTSYDEYNSEDIKIAFSRLVSQQMD